MVRLGHLAWVIVLHGLVTYAACSAHSQTPPPRRPTPEKTKASVKVTTNYTSRPIAADKRARDSVKAQAQCPEGMVLIETEGDEFCIDRWEASLVDGESEPWPGNLAIDNRESEFHAVSVSGRKPQGYISGRQAGRACDNAGKRLCQAEEWVRACRGPDDTRYPYGERRLPDVCNDRFEVLDNHPVYRLFRKEAEPGTDPKEMWGSGWMNDPRLHELTFSVTPAGQFAACTNDYGTYDMVGNLHEWVADPEGTFLGGFFMDTYQNGEGCEYRTVAHEFDYHDYSTGFRCCADPGS